MSKLQRSKRIYPVTFTERKALRFLENEASRKSAKSRRTDGGSVRNYNPRAYPSYAKYHLSAMPKQTNSTMTWSWPQTSSSALAAGTYAEIGVVIMNGAYQPCAALSATSPEGFSKMMGFYTKCAVKNATVSFTVCNVTQPPTATGRTSMLIGSSVTTDNTSLSTAKNAIENGNSTHKFVGPDNGAETITHSIDIGKFLDVGNLQSGTDYMCTSSANPGQVVDSHLWIYNNSSVACSYTYLVTLTMYGTFYDPAQI